MSLSRDVGDPAPPGVNGQRAILVISRDPELAVAMRERVDRALVSVAEVRPAEAVPTVRACHPWPWLVVGDSPDPDPGLMDVLASRPTLLLWLGQAPAGSPPHLRVLVRFTELIGAVEAALGARVCGIRLAVGSGITMPDGAHVDSPVLEALVASHPHPVDVAPARLHAVTRALRAHAVPLEARRGPRGVVLVGVGAA